MRSRYYNPSNEQERKELENEIELGHTIVCTSRPLPGEKTWVGEWCGGRHWATGDKAQFEKHWQDLDAAIIVLVDNNKLLEIAKEKYEEKHNDPNEIAYSLTWDEAIAKFGKERLAEMLLPEAPWNKVNK